MANTDNSKNESGGKGMKRRTLLKAMAGIPVMGVLGYEIAKKRSYDQHTRKRIIEELNLGDFDASLSTRGLEKSEGDLIRIGIIGMGGRSIALAKGLGFMEQSGQEAIKSSEQYESWLQQHDLNVAITGICEVYDARAERGLDIARNGSRPGMKSKLPVKHYRTYQEMIQDPDIDAVVIATPDHHHARISTEAARAGKHVYCEKCVALNEPELNELYTSVKDSGIVYQLGHQIPQNRIYQQAKELIKRNILGKISLVEVTTNRNNASGAWIRHLDKNGNPKPGDEKNIDWDQWLGQAPKVPFSKDRYYNWTKFFDYDMGLIGQLFSHEYDAINQLLGIGIPASAMSSGGIYYWKDNRDMADVLQCSLEFPEKELTLLYSATLSSARNRGRVIMGHDASMEIGNAVTIKAEPDSTKYKEQIKKGIIDPAVPMISIKPDITGIDGISSATSAYYDSRGLTRTAIGGKYVDMVYLHIKEWIDCIRSGALPSANIEKAYEEGIAGLMAHTSYVEKRRVEWDSINKKIV